MGTLLLPRPLPRRMPRHLGLTPMGGLVSGAALFPSRHEPPPLPIAEHHVLGGLQRRLLLRPAERLVSHPPAHQRCLQVAAPRRHRHHRGEVRLRLRQVSATAAPGSPPWHPVPPCPHTTSSQARGQERDPPPASSWQDRGVRRQAEEKHHAKFSCHLQFPAHFPAGAGGGEPGSQTRDSNKHQS